jgi:hypothetical protein
MLYVIAADATLLLHTLFVAFVVFGLLLVLVGKLRAWAWTRNPWFRVVHLGAIAIVVLQSWLGMICPLTSIEMQLRARAGDAVYTETFVSHWLESILYYSAPGWVFAAGYSVFGALVVASWFWARPRPFLWRDDRDEGQ